MDHDNHERLEKIWLYVDLVLFAWLGVIITRMWWHHWF